MQSTELYTAKEIIIFGLSQYNFFAETFCNLRDAFQSVRHFQVSLITYHNIFVLQYYYEILICKTSDIVRFQLDRVSHEFEFSIVSIALKMTDAYSLEDQETEPFCASESPVNQPSVAVNVTKLLFTKNDKVRNVLAN